MVHVYDFPLDAGADAVGRPSTDAEETDVTESTMDVGDAVGNDEQQERLTAAASDDAEDEGRTSQGPGVEEAASDTGDVASDRASVREDLQEALDA